MMGSRDSLISPISFEGDGRLASAIQVCEADLSAVEWLYDAPGSYRRRELLEPLIADWRSWLAALPLADLTAAERLDAFLLDHHLACRARDMERERDRTEAAAAARPWLGEIIRLLDAHRAKADLDPAASAQLLAEGWKGIEALKQSLSSSASDPEVHRAARLLERLWPQLQEWRTFYAGYHPMFSWWTAQPFGAMQQAMERFADARRSAGEGAIGGDPVGREALIDDLEAALIPYTPEELIAIGDAEMAWCRRELERAASDLGCGGDWRNALDRVKEDHVEPGQQAFYVRDLAREAVAFLEERGLLTIPPLARDGWRMEMMSPERQKANPFFLGGSAIYISYPTDAMSDEEKRMAMRGNNRHFSRATVQHELVPGHFMQSFSGRRYRPYRGLFWTPFWTEGWALYWEMRLYELGFPRTPEERIGMLFWRTHRAARVAFSLRFHMGQMDAGECVEMLVRDVGHERSTAEGEVRRSFGGDYPPLYQCAYLIGGLQFRALHRELVGPGGLDDRSFHDAVLRENCMPVAMLRTALRREPARPGALFRWRFADHLLG
ncbi:MAG: DUF885 family protein [Chthonomonadales bacterium]|nr:DUF885 family protein [Chthonomonadales bacterium]